MSGIMALSPPNRVRVKSREPGFELWRVPLIPYFSFESGAQLLLRPADARGKRFGKVGAGWIRHGRTIPPPPRPDERKGSDQAASPHIPWESYRRF
ncbi:hypothetical protein CBW24_13970 [Pacificitalea manganoxidans]|uniref:Uncharacterized protein n=1 Tax=Pacificitalea manganoxidans TaxID=1411902 RepID=A0A291M210_9RHOB|nr:hypothetical protein CBW24_13970 [Pacificitalea manganoxidans]OWU70081.1 hypothetical protein ATO2_05710 [Roseovarius sp. 22II1-1F6A]